MPADNPIKMTIPGLTTSQLPDKLLLNGKQYLATDADENDPVYLLDKTFVDSERGNTLLVEADTGNFVCWLHLGEHARLEISWVPENYPALNVSLVKLTDAELAEHIQKRCAGYAIRKCNTPGIAYTGGFDFQTVVDADDEEAMLEAKHTE